MAVDVALLVLLNEATEPMLLLLALPTLLLLPPPHTPPADQSAACSAGTAIAARFIPLPLSVRAGPPAGPDPPALLSMRGEGPLRLSKAFCSFMTWSFSSCKSDSPPATAETAGAAPPAAGAPAGAVPAACAGRGQDVAEPKGGACAVACCRVGVPGPEDCERADWPWIALRYLRGEQPRN